MRFEVVSLLQDGSHVAVVDDVDSDAQTTSTVLEDAGLVPVTVNIPSGADELVDSLVGHFAGVVCDHRLHGKADYFGAQIVAKCMQRGLPAVLLTTFADPRDNALIQTYRPQIPALLMRGLDSTGSNIRKALEYAEAETHGNYRITREPHRTVARVTARHDDPPQTIELLIPAWSTSQVVSVPTNSLGDAAGIARVGQRFLADVNIYADSHLDLYAANFESIPDASFDDLVNDL
ncbi:hypothetical protein G7072_11215 [Nocardioides sp. HDW12B]|uniref:hypothetical protein n=1 Tax=Nocardioides sp. HDW12B TaxID=2714939 RepID=UPI001408AD50|nr:hypothetical protein [Nocardioides sp. HDW12B]QIK66834.1 hypothetical protein G7072_11215 [Nocardioides sp. HDW12B]